MMGGDWHALAEEQLQGILEGELDWSTFLYDELPEKPRECFSEAEPYWNELRELLADEDACGLEMIEDIPEATFYSQAADVADIARRLEQVTEDELRSRFEGLDTEADFDELHLLVKSLLAFYLRAAGNGDAVLFRVT